MTKPLLALAAALTFSAAAQAQPSMAPPAAPQTIRVAAVEPAQIQPAPPPAPAYEAPPAAPQASAPAPAAPPAAAYEASAPAYQPPPPAPRPQGYRSASYKGGEGATWKTGRDAYGFSGTYGGCRYTGHAGRGGFSIDRICR